jgi:ring-1,2-phenylacetyl-CoA epoxidase subunit PaaE
MSDTEFYTLRVKEVRPETKDAATVFFEVPAELADRFAYQQGQYLTLRFHLNGQEVRRAYSMCSSPLEKDLAVTVKRLEGGLVSNHINDRLEAGAEVEVMPPQGRFYTELDPEQRKDYFLFGAGSGITPLMSILKTVLEQEPSSNVYLLYGNRDEDSIIFRDQLERLSQRYTGQLVVEHTLSRPQREKRSGLSGLFSRGKITWEGLQGRIGADAVQRFLRDYEAPAKPAEYFVCGPGLMIDTVEAAQRARRRRPTHPYRTLCLRRRR